MRSWNHKNDTTVPGSNAWHFCSCSSTHGTWNRELFSFHFNVWSSQNSRKTVPQWQTCDREAPLADVYNMIKDIQEAQLSQRDRAAACLNYGKNISAKSAHLGYFFKSVPTVSSRALSRFTHYVYASFCHVTRAPCAPYRTHWPFLAS